MNPDSNTENAKPDCNVWWIPTPPPSFRHPNRECEGFAPLCMSYEGKHKFVASGGFADVFLATNQVNGETIAVKVLKGTKVKQLRDSLREEITKFVGQFPVINGANHCEMLVKQLPKMQHILSLIDAQIEESAAGAGTYVRDVSGLGLCIVGTVLVQQQPMKYICELGCRSLARVVASGISADSFSEMYMETGAGSDDLNDALNAMKHANPFLVSEIELLTGDSGKLDGSPKSLEGFLQDCASKMPGVKFSYAKLKEAVPNELYIAVRVNDWDIDEYTNSKLSWVQTVRVQCSTFGADDGKYAAIQTTEDTKDTMISQTLLVDEEWICWSDKSKSCEEVQGALPDSFWTGGQNASKVWNVHAVDLDLKNLARVGSVSGNAYLKGKLELALEPYLSPEQKANLEAIGDQMAKTLADFGWTTVDGDAFGMPKTLEKSQMSQVFILSKPTTLGHHKKVKSKMIADIESCQKGIKDKEISANKAIEVDKTNNAMLKHRNIVRSLGGADGPLYELDCKESRIPQTESAIAIYMENMPGGSLADVLNLNACNGMMGVPERQIKKWLPQVLCGLQYLHSNDVLHRDMKAENVLISSDMETVKIADFGSVVNAVDADDFIAEDEADATGWTPAYIAPEFFLQVPFNQSSDIWAVGCLLLELWSGKLGADFWQLRGRDALSDLKDCGPSIAVVIQAMDVTNQGAWAQTILTNICATLANGGHPPLPDEMNPTISRFALLCFTEDPDKRPTVSYPAAFFLMLNNSLSLGTPAPPPPSHAKDGIFSHNCVEQ